MEKVGETGRGQHYQGAGSSEVCKALSLPPYRVKMTLHTPEGPVLRD